MTWTEQPNDTHTTQIGAYAISISKSEQYQKWAFIVTRDGRMVTAGDRGTLEEAKEQAEAAVAELDKPKK